LLYFGAAFKDSLVGVYKKTRKEADLFDVTIFKSKTKITIELVKDLLLADDSALVPHHSDNIQTL